MDLPKSSYQNLRASERSKRLGRDGTLPRNSYCDEQKIKEGRGDEDRSLKNDEPNEAKKKIAPTACRVSVHAVVVVVGTRVRKRHAKGR